MSDRPDERRDADDAPPATDAAGEPQRRVDEERWQASVTSWGAARPGSDPAGDDDDADDARSSTREIVVGATGPSDGAPAEPAPAGGTPGSTPRPAWEQAPAWQQAPSASGGRAQAPAPAPAPVSPSWQAEPAWQQPPSWDRSASWEPGRPAGPGGAQPADGGLPQPSWRTAEQPPAQHTPTWRQATPAEGSTKGPTNGPAQDGAPTGPHARSAQHGAPPSGPSQPGGTPGRGTQGGATNGSWGPTSHRAEDGPARPAGPPPSLTSQSLTRQAETAPTRGWRRLVHKATAGTYNPGLSREETEHRALVARVTTPVRGSNRIAVVSLKGGIGKTTTTACLGLTLAHHRGDRVVALDANPDAGTLAERLTDVTDVTVRDLLAGVGQIRSFTDVSAYTSLAGRLQVLASDQDPALSEAFSEAEYTTVADILARYFNLILTDSGTGLLHSAMSGTLAIADSLVVVGAPSVDGASRASKTLDWLIAHGHEDLVARSVAVIASVRPNTGDVDMDLVRAHFAARCRAVVEIPYDQHLVTGGLIDLDRVGSPARRAYLELAAAVADGFALPPLTRASAAAG